MSSKALQSLVKRIFADAEFKRRFLSSPDEVIRQFRLNSEEKEAVHRVKSRLLAATDQGQLEADVEPLSFWLS